MGKIALYFDELDPEQSKRLIAAYEQIVGRPMEEFARTAAGIMEVQHQQQAAAPAPQPQHQQPAPPPAPQPQHQPAPQPQPAAPAQPQPQPSGGQVASGALDAFGVPYNPQLHSVTDGPSGGRNKDGSWKMKKNTDKAAYKDWADRHKRAPGAAAPQPAPQPQPQPAPASPAPAASPAGAPPFPGTAPVGGVPAFPGLNPGSGWPQPAQPPLQEVSFPLFCAKVNDLSRKGLLTAQISARIMETVGCTDVDKLNRDPHFRTLAYAELMKIDATEVAPAQV